MAIASSVFQGNVAAMGGAISSFTAGTVTIDTAWFCKILIGDSMSVEWPDQWAMYESPRALPGCVFDSNVAYTGGALAVRHVTGQGHLNKPVGASQGFAGAG